MMLHNLSQEAASREEPTARAEALARGSRLSDRDVVQTRPFDAALDS